MINSIDTKFQEYGEYLYDHVILFCTSEAGFSTKITLILIVFKEPKAVSAKQILKFFDEGGNVLIAGDIDTSRLYRGLINSFGVEMDLIGS